MIGILGTLFYLIKLMVQGAQEYKKRRMEESENQIKSSEEEIEEGGIMNTLKEILKELRSIKEELRKNKKELDDKLQRLQTAMQDEKREREQEREERKEWKKGVEVSIEKRWLEIEAKLGKGQSESKNVEESNLRGGHHDKMEMKKGEDLSDQLGAVNNRMEDLENRSRRENIVTYGVEDEDGERREEVERKVQEFLKEGIKRTAAATASPSNELAKIPEKVPDSDDLQEDDNPDDSVGNDGPSCYQLVRNGSSAILNSNGANIEHNTFHIQLSQFDRIEEMLDIADYLKMPYRIDQERDTRKREQERDIHFHLMDSSEVKIPSLHSVEDIFLPVQENRNPPRRVLILNEEKFIGRHLACVWGTQERSFMDNFSIVYLIQNTLDESTTVEAEILSICGSAGCELKPIDIFIATKQWRQKALIIIEDLDKMDHDTRQDLLQLFHFQNPVDTGSFAMYLKLATFVVVSSSEPVDGLQFEKTVAVSPSIKQLLM